MSRPPVIDYEDRPEPLPTIRTLHELSLDYTYKVLKECRWNRTRAARALDISLRTVRNYINELKQSGVKIPDSAAGGYRSKP